MNDAFYFNRNPVKIAVSFSTLELSVIEFRLVPESTPSFQVVKGPDRVFRVLVGGLEAFINDTEKHILRQHDILSVSEDDYCLIRSLSRDVTTVEVVSASDALEQFVYAVGKVKPGIGLPEDMNEVAERFGLVVHSPPPPAPVIQGFTIPGNQNYAATKSI